MAVFLLLLAITHLGDIFGFLYGAADAVYRFFFDKSLGIAIQQFFGHVVIVVGFAVVVHVMFGEKARPLYKVYRVIGVTAKRVLVATWRWTRAQLRAGKDADKK